MRHSCTGDMPLAYKHHKNKACDAGRALRACRYLHTGSVSLLMLFPLRRMLIPG